MNINDVWPKRWRLRHMMCKHRSSSDHCICLPPLLTIFTEMFLRGKPAFCSHYDDAVTDILCWYIDIFIFPNILKIIIIKDYFSRQHSFVCHYSSCCGHVWRPASWPAAADHVTVTDADIHPCIAHRNDQTPQLVVVFCRPDSYLQSNIDQRDSNSITHSYTEDYTVTTLIAKINKIKDLPQIFLISFFTQ